MSHVPRINESCRTPHIDEMPHIWKSCATYLNGSRPTHNVTTWVRHIHMHLYIPPHTQRDNTSEAYPYASLYIAPHIYEDIYVYVCIYEDIYVWQREIAPHTQRDNASEASPTNEGVTGHVQISGITNPNNSYHTCECVMSHRNQSRYTYDKVTSQICLS